MKTRTIGGVQVGALGLGCMGMSFAYGAGDDEQSIQVLNRALDLGINFWDTADIYGPEKNERLLANVLKTRRDEVFLATKFGIVYDPSMTSHQHKVTPQGGRIIDGTPTYIAQAVEKSLQRLNVDVIDLYYLHRVDADTPIEETVGAMARLIEQGKVKHIGLSEASAATLRRAHKVHPITALQSEYSIWSRDIEPEILPTARELGITLVPYSPVGRGFLTGEIKSPNDFAADDFRRILPRFQGDAFQENLKMVDVIQDLASKKGCTAAQLALAWVLAKGEDLIPIPGTKRLKYLEENAASADINLSSEEENALSALAPTGDRYAPEMMKMVSI